MAFSHVRKAFRPIRRDLSKHTTEFIQQVQVQVQCAKTSVTRKLFYQKYKNTSTFSNGSRIHEIWEFKKSQLTTILSSNKTKIQELRRTRDVKLLIEFLREKHDQRNPEDIEAEELNEYLCEFILSVKRKDGKDFEPSSLRGMFSSFNRHLKECKYPVSVIEDVAFERARKCLEAKNKQLKKEGKGNRPNAAEALSDDEISILYEKNLLGISNGEALINTLWLFNSLHFGLRGCGEHRQMCWGDVQLMKDADGTEYLHFSERQTKTRSGADPRNVRPIKPKAFATPDLPRERDPVVVFKIYSEKRPESMNKPDAPFYLGVNHTTKNSDKSWFKASAMGVNKLNSLMKTMAERAGLDSSHLTNHSARKRMIQTLNDKDIPPSHIMQLSGHKNVQSINNYSHVSQEQQKSMSRILSGSTSMVQTENTLSCRNKTTSKSNADNSRAIQGCRVLRRKFHYQYQLVLVFNRRTYKTATNL